MISAKTLPSTLSVFLVRYGAIPEVGRFVADTAEVDWERGSRVVVESHRGVEMGTLLEKTKQPVDDDNTPQMNVLRLASDDDLRLFDELQQECRREFETWVERIVEWKLDLELIDSEWMLDRKKLVLYVLNDRGGDCTKLALFAAAGGFGTVEVQPIDAGGLVQLPQAGGGGCGSGGGGCGSCGTH